MTLSNAESKACCAKVYEHDLVALVLGDSYHPGGLRLTRALATAAGVDASTRVLDIACGPGSTALTLAAEYGADVLGIDYSQASVADAQAAPRAAGLAGRASFQVGDAEHLPFGPASMDVIVSECAFCLFSDKERAAREIAGLLVPGGRLALSDVVVDLDALHAGLRDFAGYLACIADARPADFYVDLFESVGLEVTQVERRDEAVARMLAQIEARLKVADMVGLEALADIDVEALHKRLLLAQDAVTDGTAGYISLIATRLGAG